MPSLIKHASESTHWYQKDGTPQHDADLRVARKELLYPSVTSIDKSTFPNPRLEKWKVEQAIIAGIDNPRQPHETAEQYAQRVYELSLVKSVTASDFGTKVHKCIENYPALPEEEELKPYFSAFSEWYSRSGLVSTATELTVVDPNIGVAGRLDFTGNDSVANRPCLVDWKSQGVKVQPNGKKKPAYYDSWVRQLAFYAVALSKQKNVFPDLPACASVVIDSTEPHEPYLKWWTDEEIRSAYSDFICGTWLWMHSRSYWPVGQWKIQDHILL